MWARMVNMHPWKIQTQILDRNLQTHSYTFNLHLHLADYFIQSALEWFIHTFRNQRRSKRSKAPPSSLGAVRVRCLAQGHLDTPGMKLATFRLKVNLLYLLGWVDPMYAMASLYNVCVLFQWTYHVIECRVYISRLVSIFKIKSLIIFMQYIR